MGRRKIEIRDEEIYELREKGMSYGEIAKYFTKKGVKIGLCTIRLRCKKIYEEKGEEDPKEEEIKKRNSVTNEEIYELREQGMTYKEIMEYFEKKGVKIGLCTIRLRCKKIYEEKGEEDPKEEIKKRNSVTNEELYKLRNQGMTYKEIMEYFEKKGVKISIKTLSVRCKKIYKEKGEEELKIKNRINEATDEEIYELREQGMTYERIAEYYSIKGIKITYSAIGYRCKKIYKEKGKEEPKIKNRINEATDEEIYELRNQGMTYKEIMEYFEKKGVKISINTLSVRCKKIYKEKGREEPKIKRKNMVKEATDEEIYELREQGKSYEEIARYYKEKGIEITRVAIGKRCKKIYNEKGKEAPKIKKGKNKREDVTDEEIYELREQGMSYKGMMEYFEQKDVKISKSLLSKRLKEIYKEKGKEDPKIKKEKNKREDVTDEEIYELREQGMSYGDIVRYYNEKGIQIGQTTIVYRCKKIYNEKGKEEPKAKRGRKKNNNTKLLGNLNNTLNKRIKEKIGTEQALAELNYKEKNTEGAEK